MLDYEAYRPHIRKLPDLTNLTQTLDTEITCTVCRGCKWHYVYSDEYGYLTYSKCVNCNGTGLMRGKTSEEQWALEHGKRR